VNRYMTWREICPILLRTMRDGKVHARKDLKRIPEKTPGYDHDPGRHGKDSMTAYRTGWSLTLLNNAKLVENVGIGLWRMADKAKQMSEKQIFELLEVTAHEMQTNATQKRKRAGKDGPIKPQLAGKESTAVNEFRSPSMEHIRSLISLKNAGLITLEAAMQGIEKAAFA
jgi:restriction endonuclease Mrr